MLSVKSWTKLEKALRLPIRPLLRPHLPWALVYHVAYNLVRAHFVHIYNAFLLYDDEFKFYGS